MEINPSYYSPIPIVQHMKYKRKTTIAHDDYKACLLNGIAVYKTMNVIRSYKPDMYTKEVNKIALTADDDNRVIMENGIHTLALGHFTLILK